MSAPTLIIWISVPSVTKMGKEPSSNILPELYTGLCSDVLSLLSFWQHRFYDGEECRRNLRGEFHIFSNVCLNGLRKAINTVSTGRLFTNVRSWVLPIMKQHFTLLYRNVWPPSLVSIYFLLRSDFVSSFSFSLVINQSVLTTGWTVGVSILGRGKNFLYSMASLWALGPSQWAPGPIYSV
jgi:hypothetical protein